MTKAVLECTGLGWLMMLSMRYSALQESRVGSSSCENLILSPVGFHWLGTIILYSAFPSSIDKK